MIRRNNCQITDDAAGRASVSETFVSRVLEGRNYLADAARNRIKTAAAKVGYASSRRAGGFRPSNASFIAVALPRLDTSDFQDILSGITGAMATVKCRPVFGVTEYSEEQDDALVRDLLLWRPSSIVLAGLDHSDATKSAVKEAGVNVVEVLDIDGAPISAAFGFSQIAAGRATAKHMLAKGHRRFVYAGCQTGLDLRAAKRFEGFRQALREAGASLLSQEVRPTLSSIVEGRRITAEILSRSERPDAIYFSNDDLATGAVMHCLSQGLRMPEDIALAGFNGQNYLEALPVRLTTIEIPRYEIGQEVGKFLSKSKSDRAQNLPLSVDLGFNLIAGQTC